MGRRNTIHQEKRKENEEENQIITSGLIGSETGFFAVIADIFPQQGSRRLSDYKYLRFINENICSANAPSEVFRVNDFVMS